MNTQVEKLRLIEWIVRLNDQSILDKILRIKEKSGQKDTDWYNTISQAETESIDRGLSDLKEGKVKSHSQVHKKYKKWVN